jgi:hypothetical protein
MIEFMRRHAAAVTGALSGLDRLRLRGTKRLLHRVGGMLNFLSQKRILLRDFKAYTTAVTERIRRTTEERARAAQRPLIYLHSSTTSKEEVARDVARRDGIQEGLICVLSCVERCWSYELYRNRQEKTLELRGGVRKCLHYYHYLFHPQLGFMHVRLQTWFPLTIHACLNGREWLRRQMDAARIDYVQRDNCFTHIADVSAAQALMHEQMRTDWNALLEGLVRALHPTDTEIFRDCPVPYYWSTDQSEWASDVMFRSPADLAELYPRLIRHGVEHLGSAEVMRFLGRQVPAHNGKYGTFKGEVVTDLHERPEGMRIKHRVGKNSVKMYDKQSRVLRVETTINDPHDLKVYRPKEGDPNGPKDWRYMRKGIADLPRRGQASQAINDRYFNALAAVEQEAQTLGALTAKVCRPVVWKGKRSRAINPLSSDDAKLLAAVNRGEFLINGFRNRDLRPLLYGSGTVAPKEVRRRSAAITRKLRMLRAHGLIKKVPQSHRYRLTKTGQIAITALLAARAADTNKLLNAA